MNKRKVTIMTTAIIFALAVTVSMAQAGAVLPNTGQNTETRTVDGKTISFDSQWEVAFLGNMGIGIDTTPGPLPSADEIWAAIQRETFQQATVYDTTTWPLGPDGEGNTPWGESSTDANGYNIGWIGASPENTRTGSGNLGELLSNDAGYYAFRLKFDTTPEALVEMGMFINSDNDVLYTFFDGQLINLIEDVEMREDDSAPRYFDTSLLETAFSGSNELIFIVGNIGNCENYGNPVGLWVSFDVVDIEPRVTNTPEPATLLLSGLGGLGLLVMRSRRRNRKV